VVVLLALTAAIGCKPKAATSLHGSTYGAAVEVPRPLPSFNGSFEPMACDFAGPQTPRDVTGVDGTNSYKVEGLQRTTSTEGMRICNVHFHRFAEHRSQGQYDVDRGREGWACRRADATSDDGQGAPGEDGGLDEQAPVQDGDTIEVHWAHTSCPQELIDESIAAALEKDPKAITGLAPCACPGAEIVFEARVFRVSKDSGLDTLTNTPPPPTGELARFFGSTTGAVYNGKCSPIQSGWRVDKSCGELRLSALEAWLQDPRGARLFNESHPHPVRELVTDPKLLSRFESKP
jgi:hypothetical protein